jgi:hypothetical protein
MRSWRSVRTAFALVLLGGPAGACGAREPRPSDEYAIETPTGKPLFLSFTSRDDPVSVVARDRRTGRCRWLPIHDLVVAARGPSIERAGPEEDSFLWVAGCRELKLPYPAPAAPLRLAYGPRVRLRVRTDGRLPDLPGRIDLTFTWRGPGDAPDAPFLHEFDGAAPEGWFPRKRFTSARSTISVTSADPSVAVRFSRPGPYRVTWMYMVHTPIEGGYTGSGIGLSGAGTTIDVADGVDEQVVELRIPGIAIEEAATSLHPK